MDGTSQSLSAAERERVRPGTKVVSGMLYCDKNHKKQFPGSDTNTELQSKYVVSNAFLLKASLQASANTLQHCFVLRGCSPAKLSSGLIPFAPLGVFLPLSTWFYAHASGRV